MRSAGCDRGWLLVGLIVILSSVFLAMGGIAVALAESRRTISLRENDTEAAYLAQAGVMHGLYQFRQIPEPAPQGIQLGTYSIEDLSRPPGDPTDDVFILRGKAADFLLAVMTNATVTTNPRDRLRDWTLRNVLRTEDTMSQDPPEGMPLTILEQRVYDLQRALAIALSVAAFSALLS